MAVRNETQYTVDPVLEGRTLAERFLETVHRFSSRPAIRWKEGNAWAEKSYRQLGDLVFDCAAGLLKRGIEPGDFVAIWLETSWQWIVADWATQLIGATTVTIYHTLPPNQAAGLLIDSGAKALFSTQARLASLTHEESLEEHPDLEVSIDGGEVGFSFDSLLKEGRTSREDDDDIARVLSDPPATEDTLSAIIYTSGTTGVPKGVMLTNRNVLSNVDGLVSDFASDRVHTTLLHLPLAHVVARNSVVPGMLFSGGVIAIAEPEREKLPQNLMEVAPTLLATVPFLLDKFRRRVSENLADASPLKKTLAKAALATGRNHRVKPLHRGGPVRAGNEGLTLKLFDRLVFRKIRERLGGRLEIIIIGAANSDLASLEFFWAMGIQVYEAYGLTETTNCTSWTCPADMKIGTVGHACPRMEFKLADDGEVLIRGTNIMEGYWNRPEETREAIDEDGWFHSGDIGTIDDEGYLRIVDRKKEIFVLTTGKNVAPQAIENALKRTDAIVNACAIGDNRKFMAALVVPDLAVVQKRLGLESLPDVEDERVRGFVIDEARRVMSGLAGFERIKTFILLDEDFTLEDGLLTPTMKLRRAKIAERYTDEIEFLYGDNDRRVSI